MQITNIGRRSL